MFRTCRWPVVPLVFCACLILFEHRPAFGQPPPGRIFGQPPPATPLAAASVEPLRTAGDRSFDIRDIRLDLRVDLPKKTVDSRATVQLRSLRPMKSITLDAVGFEVKQVALATSNQGTTPARFSHDGKKLIVELNSSWPAGQEGTLRVDYRVREPKDGLHFFSPSASDPTVPLSVWSQGEPISNRYWFPCLDEPNQRQTTELVVTVPDGFEAISNGKLVERKENPNDKTVTFDWRQDKPHPSYLVTLVVGQFDVVREEWDKVPVLYYVPKGRKDEVAATFGRTRAMLSYFSKRFGIHYPWDKYAQVVAYQFGGGMENTSATTLGDRALTDQRALLDRTPDGLIAHELAHQWWGDLVTCRDWAHLWLNEGFASYAEALWEEESKGPDAYAYAIFNKAAGAIGGGKNRPVVDRHYPTPGSMFDGRSYPKGAWVLHMLRRRLGDEVFWRCIQRYGTEHRLQSAETADFRRTLERETGRDLERFFYDWTERPGNPVLEIKTDYLPDAQQARVAVKQTQPGEAFQFPLTFVFHCLGVAQPTIIEQEVTDREYTLLVPLAGHPLFVDVDPEQAVLAEIKETKSQDLWRAQLLEAPGVPARIRAARHFAESKVEADRELLAGAFAHEKFWGVQVEIASALGQSGGNTCRDALLRGMQQADARVRRACIDNLAKFPQDAAIAAAVREILHKGDPSYAALGAAMVTYAKQGQKDAIAQLTPWLSKPSHNDVLRGSALAALGETHDLSTLDTLLAWSQPGKPSNCRMSALRGLVQMVQKAKPSEPQRQQILKTLTTTLESDNSFLRFTIMSTLPELGPAAQAALPALDKLAQSDGNDRLRDLAKRTAERIRETAKATLASSSSEVSQLREELKRLRQEQDALRERLNKYEASGRQRK